MKYRFQSVVLSLAVVFGGSSLSATPLLPGGTVVPPVTTTLPSGSPSTSSMVGTTNPDVEPFSWKHNNGTASNPKVIQGAGGTLFDVAFTDSNTGDLDFYYQIQNTYTGSANTQNTLLSSFQLTGWANVGITDVEQLVKTTAGNYFQQFKGATNDLVTSVSRSAGPTGIDLTVNLATGLAPGQNTSILLIKTNAKDFDLGTASLSWISMPPTCNISSTSTAPCGVADAQNFVIGALEPVVPEPSFYGLVGLGMAAMYFGVRRRRSVQA